VEPEDEVNPASVAEKFSLATSREPAGHYRDGDPIMSWRLAQDGLALAHVPDRAGLPGWAAAAFRQVTSILAGEGLPCIFARRANHLKSGWVCFVDSVETHAGREAVKRAILAYIATLTRYPQTRATIMPLMVLVKPCYPMLSLKEYRDHAWGLFQYLHDHDPEPWPVDVPTDPDRGDWSFCFGGIQLFSNVSDPAHQIHKSRNLGDSLVFAMQPRTNFDLVGGNTRKGRQVRNEIRERVERYEGQPVASHLGFYGTPENREWLQMATKDGDADHDFPEVCPFKLRSDKAPVQK
jgi:FPC/CPF motif-containing protein YcgG